MDRRKFVQGILASGTALGAGSVLASTPKSPAWFGASSGGSEIALAAKRYDGQSGSAIFNGSIPMRPGQLFPGGISNVSLWGASGELPVRIKALTPRHADGSVKAIQVQSQLTLASGTEVTLVLRLDEPPTAGSVTELAVGTSWMQAPTLIACTDPVHLCASRIALLPLVPITHPNLPSAWKTFLTSQFDDTTGSWPTAGKPLLHYRGGGGDWPGGGANYNSLGIYYQRYLVSGEIDRLADATFMSTKATGRGPGFSSQACSPGGLREGDGSGPVIDCNLENYAIGSNSYPIDTEPASGWHHDAWYAHVLTGWLQPKHVLMRSGARAWGTSNADGWYAPRTYYRWQREAMVLLAMLHDDRDLYYYHPDYQVSCPSYVNNRSLWNDRLQQRFFDYCVSENAGFSDPSDYRFGAWGTSPGYGGARDQYGHVPNFQQITAFACLSFLQLNLLQDDRAWSGISSMGEFTYNQSKGPYGPGWNSGIDWYVQSYWDSDPATSNLDLPGNNPWSVTNNLALMAYAYAYTGDEKFLDVIDLHCDNRSFVYYTNKGGAGDGWKQVGECYHMAFHAAAWRAGVAHNSWG